MSERKKVSEETDKPEVYQIRRIGILHSCFHEKFGTPRQPGLVPSASGVIEIDKDFSKPDAFQMLEGFSHIWVMFLFHDAVREKQPEASKVRPPRLGGNQQVGVFASRSPFRPNRLGMSVLKLEKTEFFHGRMYIHVSGLDMIEGTPVVDIKPYLPYCDAISGARGGYASNAPGKQFDVQFSEAASEVLRGLPDERTTRSLIVEVLQLDPRPAYQDSSDVQSSYGMTISGLNIRWEVRDAYIEVTEITPLSRETN